MITILSFLKINYWLLLNNNNIVNKYKTMTNAVVSDFALSNIGRTGEKGPKSKVNHFI